MIDGGLILIGFLSPESKSSLSNVFYVRQRVTNSLFCSTFIILLKAATLVLLTHHKPLCGSFQFKQKRSLTTTPVNITGCISDITYSKNSQKNCVPRLSFIIQVDVCNFLEIIDAQSNNKENKSFTSFKAFLDSGNNSKTLYDLPNY